MNKETKDLLLSVVYAIITIIIFIWLIYKLFPPTLQYSIQDVWMWCCNNLNSTISPTGDNCSNVINYIYGGDC